MHYYLGERGKLPQMPVGDAILEGGVKGLEGFDSGQMCLLDPALLGTVFAVGDLVLEAAYEELLVGNSFGQQLKGVVGQVG